MYTLRKHFNIEKENSTPNIADFKSVLAKLTEGSVVIEKTNRPVLSPLFAIFNMGRNINRVYAYGAIGFAALILMVISNTNNTVVTDNNNLAMNTVPIQMKTNPVNDAINVVDSVDSFGDTTK